MADRAMSGGKAIARVLKEEGAEYIFGIGGGHITPIMVGAGMAGIKMVHMRHEQAGGYAADAFARSSGKFGVCFGTAGPGMTNTVSAIAQAYFCKSPVVALYGQHSTFEDGRGALQECFAEPIMRSITKWTRRVSDPSVFALWTKRAIRDAMTYPQGPVALEFPRNLQIVKLPAAGQSGFTDNAYPEPDPPEASARSVEKAVKTLLSAERPVIAGGEDIFWSHAEKELQEFVELTNIPVITRRVGRGAVPEDHPLAFGGRARGTILRSADVACTIGLNLGYLEGYGAWAAKAKLIQITESKTDVEFAVPSALVIIASPKAVLRQMIDYVKDAYKGKAVPKKEAWLKQMGEIKEKEQKRLADEAEAVKNNVPLHPLWVAKATCDVLDRDATIILDGYTSSHFFTEKFQAKHSGGVLDGGNWAGVGHGVGMGIGAQLARPGKQILVVMGDGGMGLGGFDVETAVRAQLPVVYLLSNNNAWMSATGPMYKKAMPTVGVDDPWTPYSILPTHYDTLFASMGAWVERVEDPAQLRPALERAFKSGKTAVLDVVVDKRVPASTGAGPIPLATQAKTNLAFLDPEDVPDNIRKQMYPDLA